MFKQVRDLIHLLGENVGTVKMEFDFVSTLIYQSPVRHLFCLDILAVSNRNVVLRHTTSFEHGP